MNFWAKLKKPILALAPMAGITDSAFRQLCKYYGADVLYSEMTSADGLAYESKKTLKMLDHSAGEKPLVIQLFGKKPEHFKTAAKLVAKSGAQGIDINFGCPARKVVAHGGGISLMKDFKLCKEIISYACDGSSLPVSIKIRTSIKGISAFDFLQYLKDLPIAAVMIHGRSYEQGFSGPIDFSFVKKIKQQFKGIVLVNGGINTPIDAEISLDKTQADGLGLARGVLGKPWLFEQIKDYLSKGAFSEYGFEDIKTVAIRHVQLVYKTKGNHGIIETRKHLAWYFKSFPNAKNLRSRLVRANTIKEVKDILK